MQIFWGRISLALAGLCLATPMAAQGPQNVLLVINDGSSISRSIGEYYASRRAIPRKNICRIHTTGDQYIARAVYDREIAAPVATCLRTGGLTEQILYIVTTLGVPLKVEGSLGMEGDVAAVDSELTLLYSDMHSGKQHATRGVIPNPFYGERGTAFSHPKFPIYLVTRLAAYDLATVEAMIDRSLHARNEGKFVIDLTDNNEKDGNAWLRSAAVFLPADRVILDESPAILYNQQNVIGYASYGSNDPNRKKRMLEFHWLPGAIATEFVSTDGRTFERPSTTWNISANWNATRLFFAGSPQSLSADFLQEGATGASGHVAEPYLAFTPRPDLLLPSYFQGRNLAESYYLSIRALSWQNIVVGDPLCSIGPPK